MSDARVIWKNRVSLVTNIGRYVREHGLSPTLRYCRHLVSERLNERRYGIVTRERVDLGEHGYDDRYVSHHPTPYRALETIFRSLPYEGGYRDVLVDFGSGAGRSTFVACKVHPFKAAYGVELMPSLVRLAEDNHKRLRTGLACRDIQFVQADAVAFALPEDSTVCFFFNPFKGDILNKVFDNIRASIRASPRPVLIVYLNPMAAPPAWMTRVAVISTYPFECHVYRAAPDTVER